MDRRYWLLVPLLAACSLNPQGEDPGVFEDSADGNSASIPPGSVAGGAGTTSPMPNTGGGYAPDGTIGGSIPDTAGPTSPLPGAPGGSEMGAGSDPGSAPTDGAPAEQPTDDDGTPSDAPDAGAAPTSVDAGGEMLPGQLYNAAAEGEAGAAGEAEADAAATLGEAGASDAGRAR